MTRAAANEMRVLSATQLVDMGVVNNGFGPTSWSIQSSASGQGAPFLYLKGERETRYGINKALFYCDPGGKNMVLYVIFDPGQHARTVQAMRVLNLMLDDRTLSLRPYLEYDTISVANGWINVSIR